MNGERDIIADIELCVLCMERVTGIDREVFLNSRDFPNAYYRGMIATSLRMDGSCYSLNEIGRVLHRNHSTVLHGLKMVETVRSTPGYDDLLAVWSSYHIELLKARKLIPERDYYEYSDGERVSRLQLMKMKIVRWFKKD